MTDHKKEFISGFRSLCGRYDRRTVWRDFIDMAACAIAGTCEIRTDVKNKREKLYLSIARKYTKPELDTFAKMLGDTVMALDENREQDFLGEIFMDMDFGGERGQFFTPWSVAYLMAEMTVDSGEAKRLIEEQGYISVNDCACGAGCMLLAFAASCEKRHINYQQSVLFTARDIDPMAAEMCYIQLSLLGCPGYVIVGNSLTEPAEGTVLKPEVKNANDLWFTPLYYIRYSDFYIYGLKLKQTVGGREKQNIAGGVKKPPTVRQRRSGGDMLERIRKILGEKPK